MSARHEAAGGFAEIAIHPKFALAALWTSVMFCYVYGDIFEFFRAEMLRALLAAGRRSGRPRKRPCCSSRS
ncbi:MAG: hypothetical protein QOH81_357 [Sphingomonadales bacterium]|jgi:hypothetical protein|nr:hypothetical protein [Sphingomonadales bacterium]